MWWQNFQNRNQCDDNIFKIVIKFEFIKFQNEKKIIGVGGDELQ